MDWFIERLQQVTPTLDYQDLLKYPNEFKKLIALKLIKYSESLETVTCDLCEEDHFVTPFKNIKGEIVISCFGSRREVRPDELKIWKIDTSPFISLFLKALGIDQSNTAEIISGLLWDLGTHEINSNQYHLYFTRNITELENNNYSIIIKQPNTAIFYLGSRRTSPPVYVLLAPILEIIKDIKSDGLVIDHKILNSYFSDTLPSQKHDQPLICGKLQVDIKRAVIHYSNNSPIDIEPDNAVIKFLVILMENKRVVEYTEIAERLSLNSWHKNASNRDVARDVQFVKRNLVTFLKEKVGMSKTEIKSMIIPKKNIGYKLQCN